MVRFLPEIFSPDRLGLVLTEFLDLPVDPAVPADEIAGRRLDAAVQAWRGEAGDLPSVLAGWSDMELAAPLAGRQVPTGHPAARALEWLGRGLREGRPVPVEPARLPLAQWQLALLDIVGPLLDRARRQAAEQVRSDGDEFAARACIEWLRTPPVPVLRLLTGAFVLDMQAARSLTVDNVDVANWFDHHLAELCRSADTRDAFFARYPLLSRLVGAILQGWRDTAVEFAVRVARDRAAIAALLHRDELTLLTVEHGLGDPHRGGRTAARVTFEEGRVAYKPRPVGAAVTLRRLLDDLADRAGGRIEIFFPDVIDRGGYGWMSWIEPARCRDRSGIRRYYRRLGQLNAMAWLLGANDLHSENIVACGDTPYLVDVETLLAPAPRHADAGHDHPVPGILLDSPASTGILPFAVALDDEHDADLSAYGHQPGQLGGEVVTWDEAGTTGMHLTRRRLPQRDPSSVPLDAQGGPADPFDYSNDFVAGSSELLDVIAPLRGVLTSDQAAAGSWTSTRTRVLLRDTARYGRALEYLSHPAVLHNPFLAEGALQQLAQRPVHPDDGNCRAVLAAERAALLRGDVPHFEVATGARDLLACDGTVLPDFFAASPLDNMVARAARLDAERPALEWVTAAALRAAETNARRRYRRGLCCTEYAAASPDPSVLVAAAAAIGRRLAALACDDGTELSWLTLRVDGRERWRVVAADRSLYLGSLGVLLFLETLCDVTAMGEDVHGVRRRLRDQWAAADPATAYRGSGVFDGCGGDLYLTQVLAGRLGAVDVPTRVARIVDLLGDPGPELDLFSGAAGVALLLSRVAAAAGPDDKVRTSAVERAEPYVARILGAAIDRPVGVSWDTLDTGPAVGFAHGSSGIAYALEQVAWMVPPALAAQCRAAVRAARDWERTQFDEQSGNWRDLRSLPDDAPRFSTSWCNGSAGIGLARAAGLRDAVDGPAGDHERLRRDLDSAIEASRRDGLGLGQGLCHGDLGVAETLLVAAQATGHEQWRQLARRIGGMVAANVLECGGVATLEFGPGVDLPGLVNGAAGVGYQLLRLAVPHRVPSVLMVECDPR